MKKITINKEHFRTFQSIKQKYPDAVILLRLGNDYTTFEKDANLIHQLTGNSILEIPGIGKTCRFLFAEMDNILSKLVTAGNKVALCDQLLNPKSKS